MTKDVVFRQTEKRSYATFCLAIGRPFRNATGESETDYIHCIVWGKLAENTARYCQKGSLVGLSGRLQSRYFDREDGQRVYRTEVVGEQVRFLQTRQQAGKEFSMTLPTEDEGVPLFE